MQLINDFITPPEKIFSRGLEAEIQPAIEYLQNCRPFAVSMTNALKHIKALISTETSNDSDQDVSAYKFLLLQVYFESKFWILEKTSPH